MQLTCICRTLGEIFGTAGLVLRGCPERESELQVDPECPMHGKSREAKAKRAVWLADRAETAGEPT